jgi:hypothetical protein
MNKINNLITLHNQRNNHHIFIQLNLITLTMSYRNIFSINQFHVLLYILQIVTNQTTIINMMKLNKINFNALQI